MTITQVRIFKAEFFKALASPVRIAILDLLRDGEKSVNDIATFFELEQTSISQHLAVLRAKNLVKNRKEKNSVFYSVSDPAIFILLDDAAKIFTNNIIDLKYIMEENRSFEGNDDNNNIIL
jgi:DNA-binding transcriptional ArsR family regulator